MKVFAELNDPQVAAQLKNGAVGVIPTDTVYGLVASAGQPTAIERLYTIRQRNPAKACILLIANQQQIAHTARVGDAERALMNRYWPGPVSIIVPVDPQTPDYLRRTETSLAYRLPDYPELQALLQKTGPLLAPSANPEGKPPATNLQQAQAYFGDSVDFYVEGGDVSGRQPSILVAMQEGKITILRSRS